MNTKNRLSSHKLCILLLTTIVFISIVFINYRKLYDNTYANYEKTIDYGRIRENKIEISPVITAVFYESSKRDSKEIFSYLNHSQNYLDKKIKMIIVPAKITEKISEVIEKLYEKILQNKDVNTVNIFYHEQDDLSIHQKLQMLQSSKYFNFINLDGSTQNAELLIEKSLKEENTLTVILSDLHQTNIFDNDDYILKIIDLAKKHFYSVQIFDIIDSQIAHSMQKDYSNLFFLMPEENIPELVKQKNNLSQYSKLYGAKLMDYFKKNFIRSCQNQDNIWPKKNKDNYRLYDRGSIYITATLKNEQRSIITEKKRNNAGMIHSVISIANSLAKHHWDYNLEDIHMYLLTENEPIEENIMENNLHEDEGIYAVYNKKHLLLMPDNYQKHKNNIYEYLYKKLNIKDVNYKKMKLYKFKTVEIKDEN